MNLADRFQLKAQQWDVSIAEVRETTSSLLGFGERGPTQVVLKISKQSGDEWHSGEVLRAFDGSGVARVFESAGGAVLLERLEPGTELVDLVRSGKDDEATRILASVILQLSRHSAPPVCPSVNDWGRGFDRYLAKGDEQIQRELVNEAHELFVSLASSQRDVMLLHGDLHHYNVLFDKDRGWVAIDPKGVAGELEYEIGALLRNPNENPELLASAKTIERRLEILVTALQLDYQRTVEWSFAQAVLSAIWDLEDGWSLKSDNPSLLLAESLRRILGLKVS